MRCPSCGQENRPSAHYCSRCRTLLPRSSSSALHPGQTMNNGQYRVTRQLGKGGMGAIYLAANTQAFDRLCVIKEMLAYYEAGGEEDARRRFEREARTLASLKHPGIPDMYGYFSEGGHNYIVMEYIQGENLAKRLPSDGDAPFEPLSLDEALRYGVEICRVVEYLADVKPEPVVHNDIKPANIIIDQNSHQAVLVDFGTAKARYTLEKGGQVGRGDSDIYGTVGYAPPELYQGQSAPKSDVYALAATLYHLLTQDDPGEHPLKYPKLDQVPDGLRRVLERALAVDIDARLSPTEFRRELEALRAAETSTVPPLVFPDGDMATTVTGALDLALKHWAYARTILYDGSLDEWLRGGLYNPPAADQAKEAIRRYAEEPDAGLDHFLRALNPRMPEPEIRISPKRLDFGAIEPGESASVRLTIANVSPVGAHGTVRSSEVWLRPGAGHFGCPPNGRKDLELHVAGTGALPPGQHYTATVTMEPAGGKAVSAEVRGRVVEHAPTRALRPRPVAPPATPRRQPRSGSPQGGALRVLAIAVAVLVVGALGYLAITNLSLGGGESASRGIEALQAGDWARAQRILARLDPADRGGVDLAGHEFDVRVAPVPGGTLRMGRDDGPLDEQPAHDVAVDGFELGRYEVTNFQYQRFVQATGHPAPAHWDDGRYPSGHALDPVVDVTWDDANAYCRWLSQETGRVVRLPSEAEWEWAARGQAGRLYPWGDEDRAECRNAAAAEEGPVAVGSYACGESPFGAMDMAGNAREWTADLYGSYEQPLDPLAAGGRRVVRGGSWRSYSVASTTREHATESTSSDDLGFRVVWE